MFFRNEYEPWQQKSLCFYCGSPADTKDHIPSKVLLDKPYPDNLDEVPCCRKCNNGFSLDEEFSAVAIECVLRQSTHVKDMKREKVRIICEHSPLLLNCVEESLITDLWGNIHLSADNPRIRNFILKLAKAHIKFELGFLPLSLEATEIQIFELKHCTDTSVVEAFLAPVKVSVLPESGSRAVQLLCITANREILIPWLNSQEGMYSYHVNPETFEVRILIQEAIGIIVRFADSLTPPLL